HVRRGAGPRANIHYDARQSALARRKGRAGRAGSSLRRAAANPHARPKGGARGQAARARQLVDRREKTADRAGDGEAGWAIPVGPRNRADAKRLRQGGRAADASRIARLAGRRIRAERLAPEAAAQTDHSVERVSNVVAREREGARDRRRESMVLAVQHA